MNLPAVKARTRSGTTSLELTIPAKIVTELKIKDGDLFTVEAEPVGDNTIMIRYKRVYAQQ